MRDGPRMDAYTAALQRAVRPGCTLLDIGAGSGIFSLLACRLGAGKVYAVEPLDGVYAAERIAADNGLEDKIEFLRCRSQEVRLPAPVDVMVSDMRGASPLFTRHIPAIIDARKRLLAPGGVQIPHRDRLWAALVTLPEWYRETIELFSQAPMGLDLEVMRGAAVNATHRMAFAPDALLCEPRCWAELDYHHIETPDVRADLCWTMAEGCRAHGIGMWFETELDGHAGFSTGPGERETVYGRLVLPLAQPLALAPGDRVEVTLQARLLGEEYLWRWDTRAWNPGSSTGGGTRLRQSTLQSNLFSLEQLRAQANDYAPSLDPRGRFMGYVFSLMDGRHTLTEIARRIAGRFPERYARPQDALAAVKALARQFGR